MNSKPQKIIMLGQTNVGKTTILQSFIQGKAPQKTNSTLGACFHRYIYTDSQGDKITMDLWDTAGQQKFRSLLTLYYKNSDGVIITFDLSNETTFQAVEYWTKQIQQNCEVMPDVILVGNKSDLKIKGKGVPEQRIKLFLKSKKQWKYFQTSAKQNRNLKQIFFQISKMIKEKQKVKKVSKIKQKTTRLSQWRKSNDKKQKSCC